MNDRFSPAARAPRMPSTPDRMTAVLSTITAQARRTNLTRTADLVVVLDEAADRGVDAVRWADAERTAHQLAGSAGTFGFDEVSEIARSLERFFADAAVSGSADPVRLAEARAQLDQAGIQLTDGFES